MVDNSLLLLTRLFEDDHVKLVYKQCCVVGIVTSARIQYPQVLYYISCNS